MTDEVELQDEPVEAQVETEEPDALAVEGDEGAENEESPTSEDAEPKQKPWFTKRIDELTANWREEQRRSQQLQDALLQMQKTPEQPPVAEQTNAAPQLDDFGTYEEYVQASARYEARQEFEALQNQTKQEQERQAAEREANERRQTFESRAAALRTQLPDFDSVAMAPDLPVSQAMAEAMNMSEKGPELLYALGKNPAESARIAALPPLQAAIELGKLETTLSQPARKTQTSAPEPVAPITGGSGSQTLDPERMTADEWRLWREKQIGN